MKTMDTKKCISLVAALLFLEISSPVEACSCVSFVLQTMVCNADAALNVKFLAPSEKTGGSPTGSTNGYEIKVKEVWKGDPALMTVTFIGTMSGTSCAYVHNPNGYNEEYFITASYTAGNLVVGGCSYIAKWSELSPEKVQGIKGAYLKGCNCKIVPCYSQPCSSEPMSCILEEYEGGDADKQKNQACIPKSSTECMWKTIE